MTDPKNLANCAVENITNRVPNNQFGNDGFTTNVNIKNNTYVPPVYPHGTLDYSTTPCAEKESNYLAGLMAEALQYAGGPVNIFPLLGIHNQGSTLDQPGDGFPISSGTPAGFNALDAFNVGPTGWKSIQTGGGVVTTPAYIGYDFGTKKAWERSGTATERYFPKAPVRRQISTLKIKQGADPLTQASQIRIEASDDGVHWTRVCILAVPTTDQLVTLPINSTAPFNKWRLIPSFFNGIASNSAWIVLEIHLLESTQLSIDTIEDLILLENRHRAYCHASTLLKCTYDLLDVQTELAKFGINIPQTYIFTCSFADMVLTLGRPVLVGDVVELPGEIQYDANLKPVRKWLEITDTGWSTEGYTMNWRPNLFRFYAQPILPSIEHKDLLGVPGQVNDLQSDDNVLLQGLLQNDLSYKSNESIIQQMTDAVPLDGSDPQNIQSGTPLLHQKGGYDGKDLYVEDAIPPNGAPYTFGDVLPDIKTIVDGHYHRQTYTTVPAAIRPPDRLLYWKATDKRWKIVEVNTRNKPESHKKTIAKLMASPNSINPEEKI